jgi:hypothetical protein
LELPPAIGIRTMVLHRSDNLDRQDRSKFSIVIQELINTYLDRSDLNDRLQKLPEQFERPRPRKWQLIDWQRINCDQIIGIEPQLFLAILKGSIDTEAPIRDYTHTSRQYLDPVHPQMAKFVGGTIDENGEVKSRGLWELEECRHAPALILIYQQLSGIKIEPTAKQVRAYEPTQCPNQDLYRHGLHRIFTEYGATCLYLWLMGHSTGTLRQVLGEMVRDEVNHLINFWGFGIWLYPYPKGYRFIHSCLQLLPHRSSGTNLLKTYRRMMSVLCWSQWNSQHRWEIITTFWLVIQRLLDWHHHLRPTDLELIFGTSPIQLTTNK